MGISKLDNDQRMLVLRLHAEGLPTSYIAKEVKDQFDITITLNAIINTCKAKKHQPRIKEFKDKYMSDVRAVPIANKRIRIDDLERERLRLITLIDKNPRKSKSDVSQYLQLVAEMRRLSDTAREEMEKKPHLFQNVVLGMGDMSDDALHERKRELISRYRNSIGGRAPGADTDSGGVEPEGSE